MPTADSRADETVIGTPKRPISPATRSTSPTPPNGAALTTATSQAPARTTANGSPALRISSSAATLAKIPERCRVPRTCASSSTVRQGCST